MYDADRTGFLDPPEIVQMLKDIYGTQFMNNPHAAAIVKKIDALGDIPVDLNGFREFSKRHQALMFPAFAMQHKLRRCVLGERFWAKLSDRRVELFQGNYVSVEMFMTVHTNTDLMDVVVRGGRLATKSTIATPHNRRKTKVNLVSVHAPAPEKTLSLIEATGSVHQRSSVTISASGSMDSARSNRSNKSTPRRDEMSLPGSQNTTPRRPSKGDLGVVGVVSSIKPKAVVGLDSSSRRTMLARIQSGLELTEELITQFKEQTKRVVEPESKSRRRLTNDGSYGGTSAAFKPSEKEQPPIGIGDSSGGGTGNGKEAGIGAGIKVSDSNLNSSSKSKSRRRRSTLG